VREPAPRRHLNGGVHAGTIYCARTALSTNPRLSAACCRPSHADLPFFSRFGSSTFVRAGSYGWLSVQRVVLVGADEDAEAARDLLVGAGYSVIMVETLAQAQEHARTIAPPALFLLDEPPQKGLLAFLTGLRSARGPEAHALPVVLLSARVPGSTAGVREVVVKPMVAALLLEVVQRLFEAL